MYPKEVTAQNKQIDTTSKPPEKDLNDVKKTLPVIVDGDTLINYYFCPECKPKPGDKIIAKS